MKARMGATHFLTKTLPKVATEMALSVLAYNLTRGMNIVGMNPLIAAIRAERTLSRHSAAECSTQSTYSGCQAPMASVGAENLPNTGSHNHLIPWGSVFTQPCPARDLGIDGKG